MFPFLLSRPLTEGSVAVNLIHVCEVGSYAVIVEQIRGAVYGTLAVGLRPAENSSVRLYRS